MSINSRVKGLITRIIRKGYWYNHILFPDCRKFWDYNTFNTEVVNLGSTSGVNAFDYEGLPVKAANWALVRNPISADFAILKNYFGYLNPERSTVIIPLCPFSSLSGGYSCSEDRYYTLLYCTTISGYTYAREQQVMSMKNQPYLYYPILAVFSDIKHSIFGRKHHELTETEMQVDAKHLYESWLKEFSIKNFSDSLSLVNQDALEDAAKVLNEMISFCKERNIVPVILIPPVYHTLSELFSAEVRKVLVDSLIDKVEDKSIWYHNYMDDPAFTNNRGLFQNSFLMNKKGAELFTKQVLTDLHLL